MKIKKVGHAGTLDPLATGLLVIMLGKATKLSNQLISQNKAYKVEMKLFCETDTGDTTGKITSQQKPRFFTAKQVQQTLNYFNNYEYYQQPPHYSAIKIKGKKLYQYARQNIPVEIPSRLVKITKINEKLAKKLEKLESRLTKDQARKKFWKEKWEQDQSIIAGLIIKNNNYQEIIKQKDQHLKNTRTRIKVGKDKLLNERQQEINNLQQQIDNHVCSCPHANYDAIKQERNDYKLQLEQHVCSCSEICCVNGDYAKVKQERDSYQAQINSHVCPSVDNRELASLRREVQVKDQKIKDLEQEIKELKDKPPVVSDKQEVEKLLGVIAEKEIIIKELEVKLQSQPQEVVVDRGWSSLIKE